MNPLLQHDVNAKTDGRLQQNINQDIIYARRNVIQELLRVQNVCNSKLLSVQVESQLLVPLCLSNYYYYNY